MTTFFLGIAVGIIVAVVLGRVLRNKGAMELSDNIYYLRRYRLVCGVIAFACCCLAVALW